VKTPADRLAQKSIEGFLSNKCNLAFNRQTRMLATYDVNFTLCDYLEKRNSSNSQFYDAELLHRAKLGLHSLAFYGLTEHPSQTCKLFAKTFNNKIWIKYSNIFKQMKMTNSNSKVLETRQIMRTLNSSVIQRITSVNKLDIELFDYAAKLFNDRLVYFNIK
jgi:hypothetical protein